MQIHKTEMMRNLLNTFFLAFFLFLSFQCATPEKTPLEIEIETIENGLLGPIIADGFATNSFSLTEQMAKYNVPGVSVAVVKDGKLHWAKGYGDANTNSGTKVDENTLFQAGSISKPVAALAALKLYQEGKVDLDVDVNSYLNGWKIEENEFTVDEKVTLRRLLTHTAGTTVHGFPGYSQSDTFPSVEQVLSGEGNTPRVFVDTIPGTMWRYSGGGYTIMEKVVEDVSGLPLDAYLTQYILEPLQMTNSTYEQPLPEKYHAKASAAYYGNGAIIEGLWNNYPEQAAAGLWTTPTDLAKYCIGIQEIIAGKSDGVLAKETVEAMLTKHKNDWGLGPSLTWNNDSLRFQHSGKNAGFTNNMVAFAYAGNAIIIMTNADNGGKIIGELLSSISSYYRWGIAEPRKVELVTLTPDQLDQYAGTYQFDEQVDGIGDYLVTFTKEGNKLIFDDPNSDKGGDMYATSDSTFVDLVTGDEMVYLSDVDMPTFIWNNRFRFYKVK